MSIKCTPTHIVEDNSTTKKERSSNLELYRILVMILIVAHHYVVNSGLSAPINASLASGENVGNCVFYMLFGAWGKSGINCFVLITGYFMCKSQITFRKFLKLLMWVLTYGILITGIFTIAGYHQEDLVNMWLTAIPFVNLTDGFTSCFLVFYLCIPFLNALINSLNKRQFKLLIILLLFIYTLHGSVPGMHVSMNYVSWFSAIYMMSAYLRIYPLPNEGNTKYWGFMTGISWTLSIISILAFAWIGAKIGIDLKYFLVADSNAIFAVTNAVTSFMWFKSMHISNSKIINTIAASAFGVFLIHTRGEIMRQWLWKDTFDCVGHYDINFYWLYAISCVLAIYIVCTTIDIIRIRTIEKPLLNATEWLCMKIYNKFRKHYFFKIW